MPSANSYADISPVIFGLEGSTLTADETAFFKQIKPFGYILFARNIETPDKLRHLTDRLRALSDRAYVPILIDQEGGRVQRMRPPHWRIYEPAATFGRLWHQDPKKAIRAVWINALLIADDLRACGINVNCAPLLDLPVKGADNAIGDRAFSSQTAITMTLARIQADAFLRQGVMPVVKHIPGQGRAMVDSHYALPVVDTPLQNLIDRDFLPFFALRHYPMAITAHVVFRAVDAAMPVTHSARAIAEIIRKQIGFQGLLLSDDLSMQALQGTPDKRALACLAAGCDLVLHCNGKFDEMQAVARGLRPWQPESLARKAKWDRFASLDFEPLNGNDQQNMAQELAMLCAQK